MSHGGDETGQQSNGLTAAAFVPLTDLDDEVGPVVLDALARSRIPAYLAEAGSAGVRRLHVASADRVDARIVVLSVLRSADRADHGGPEQVPAQQDPDDPTVTRATFDQLVADWHVDTVAAVREAERDLTREDADWRARLARPQASDEVWLDEDRYLPPQPPPLPRLAGPTILAMAVLVVSIVLLGIGGEFGLASSLTMVLGICGMVLGIAILLSRLRDSPRDDGDDGSAV